ncbi:MAG: DNA-3-methyladenine glycosylase 2 family protein [Polyangiaceae bacterium]|nr:DNA-3-methyladenine glycosylase 2 family protein [Polyangiaceae bacterium]
MTVTFEIQPRGPYSLTASASFLCGFTPASSSATRTSGGMTFGFGLDGSFEPVAVSVEERGSALLVTAVGTTDVDAARRQVARILSIDHDGEAWAELGKRDPVIGALMASYDGLRPVCFYSPYEAACWGILAARTPMKMAARVRAMLSEALGKTLVVGSERIHTFPSPRALLEASTLPHVPAVKAERLRGLADAAIRGDLDVELIRSMDREVALKHLRKLDGVGEWTASHILVRGAGLTDEPAFVEPRVRAGFKLAYGLSIDPTEDELLSAAERWRPYRTWVSVLLAVHLSRTGGWDAIATRRSSRSSPTRAHVRR